MRHVYYGAMNSGEIGHKNIFYIKCFEAKVITKRAPLYVQI